MTVTIKDTCNKLTSALRAQEDGLAIKALTDLCYDSVCRTLGLNHGQRAELAIQLALLAKRSGHVINLTEEKLEPVVEQPKKVIAVPPPAINENETTLDIDVALAMLDQALADDAPKSYEGDINPHETDEVFELGQDSSLIDRLFMAIEKQAEDTTKVSAEAVFGKQTNESGNSNSNGGSSFAGGCLTDEALAAVVQERDAALGTPVSLGEFDLSGNYELTDAPVDTVVPERGYGMDFGCIQLGE